MSFPVKRKRSNVEALMRLEASMNRLEKFEIALRQALDTTMRNYPERFAHAVKWDADAYCWSFARHMMQKFRERRVYILTEVIVQAAGYVGVMPGVSTRIGIEDVYRHLGYEPPPDDPIEEVTEEIPMASEPSAFTKLFRKIFRRKNEDFPGC